MIQSMRWENWSEVLRLWSLRYLVWGIKMSKLKLSKKHFSNVQDWSNLAKHLCWDEVHENYDFIGEITLWYSGWCSRRGESQYRGRSLLLEVLPGKRQKLSYVLDKMIAQILCGLCPRYWFACVMKRNRKIKKKGKTTNVLVSLC